MIKKQSIIILLIFCFISLGAVTQEERPPKKTEDDFLKKKLIDKTRQPVYMNARIWLVFSLARFDIAIDNNLIEVRADVELRRDSKRGSLISVADVRVNDKRLEFKKDRFRISRILPGELLDEVVLKLHVPDGPCIKQVITIPTWLKLIEPKPAVYSGNANLDIKWAFSKGGSHANLRVNDFHTGKQLFKKTEFPARSVKLSTLPLKAGETLLRVFIIEPWFHVKRAADPLLTEDSEIRCISWSQSFIRVKK